MIPDEKPPINLIGRAKVPSKLWAGTPAKKPPPTKTLGMPGRKEQPKKEYLDIKDSESDVIVDDGELLCGILDKAHIGI